MYPEPIEMVKGFYGYSDAEDGIERQMSKMSIREAKERRCGEDSENEEFYT